MVLLSLFLQLFLFFTGGLRRHRLNKLILVFVWLAYVGADLVAVYALGLLSRFEYKSNNGSVSFRETDYLMYIWVPFLLVHLGGQDTITAFSIEDNNLWLRHLLNLVVQVSLALYAFCNSFGRISLQLVVSAIFIFVAGIIKYGERTWALKCGSLEGLQNSVGDYKDKEVWAINEYDNYYSRVLYARQMVLYARGLFAGVTISQLEQNVGKNLTYGVRRCENSIKVKIVKLELNMMYDILYTKAMVLQKWTGCILRSVAHISIVVAFALFMATSKNGHTMADVAITYTLFAGALLMEACAIGALMLSPLTWAHSRIQMCLSLLPFRKTIGAEAEEKQVVPISMGQFNLVTSALHDRSTPKVMLKAINALGLEHLYRDVRHVQHAEANDMVWEFVDCFGTTYTEWFFVGRTVPVGFNLLDIMSQRFEVGIIFLHLLTDVCTSQIIHLHDCGDTDTRVDETSTTLVNECDKLSNYMMYLLVLHPSMLPVSSDYAVMGLFDHMRWADTQSTSEDLSERLSELRPVVDQWYAERLKVLYSALNELSMKIPEIDNSVIIAKEFFKSRLRSPHNVLPVLKVVKETWIALLIYAASKSRGELHARRLGDGGELLTFIWLLLAHHSLGNAAEAGLTFR
uniref:DUF4220 domain-containing protein n=1 Tax=Oryza punctata TaxID=4537 RepID=A0A0E0L011_ORYPU